MCYQRRGELSVALSEANQAMSLWENVPQKSEHDETWLYVRRGEVRWATGDRQGAVADLEHAISVAGELALWRKNILLRLDAMRADGVTSSSGVDYPAPSAGSEEM
jgi:hypothetical protein